MGSAPRQSEGGCGLDRHVEDPLSAVGAEAGDAAASESVGGGQLMVIAGGREGGFVVPGFIAVDAVRGGAQGGEEVVGVLGLGGLAVGERDELQYGDEFEGSGREEPARRQRDVVGVGGGLRRSRGR